MNEARPYVPQPRSQVVVLRSDLQLVLDILIENGMVNPEDSAAVDRLWEAARTGALNG